MIHTNEEKVEVTEHADGTIKANSIEIFSPHTNEEIKKRFNQHQEDNDYALGCSCEECENFIISFINQELSDLKKSIREEIESLSPPEKYTGYGAWSPKGLSLDDHKRNWVNEILSLKSLE